MGAGGGETEPLLAAAGNTYNAQLQQRLSSQRDTAPAADDEGPLFKLGVYLGSGRKARDFGTVLLDAGCGESKFSRLTVCDVFRREPGGRGRG